MFRGTKLRNIGIVNGPFNTEAPISILTPYKIGEKYHLDDMVDVFVFKKKV